MARTFYLPDCHDFEYIARAPWPQEYIQADWIQAVTVMEQWLEQRVGGHYSQWAWHTDQNHNSWEACVAFRWAKHRTLFLLTWS